jgi:predicted phage tail protein
MLRKIHLHGHLEKFGKVLELDVATAAEAIRAIGICIPEFFEALKEGAYHVIRGSVENGFDLSGEDLVPLQLGNRDLHIMPMVVGAKSGGGMIKSILGVVLIGAAVFLSGGALGAAIGATGITWGNVAMIGAAVALAGVSSLLAPSKKDDKDDSSFTSSGPGNAYEQGSPVPLVYGEVYTGGVMISGGVDIEKVKGA